MKFLGKNLQTCFLQFSFIFGICDYHVLHEFLFLIRFTSFLGLQVARNVIILSIFSRKQFRVKKQPCNYFTSSYTTAETAAFASFSFASIYNTDIKMLGTSLTGQHFWRNFFKIFENLVLSLFSSSLVHFRKNLSFRLIIK